MREVLLRGSDAPFLEESRVAYSRTGDSRQADFMGSNVTGMAFERGARTGVRRIVRTVFPLLVAASAVGAEYRIVGDLGEVVEEGEVVLTRSTAVLGSSAEVASAPIADGRFELVGEVVDMGRVSLSAKDADGNSRGSAQFILEPGETRITHGGRVAGLTVSGGHYTQRVVAAWRDTEEYQGVLEDYSRVMDEKADMEEGPERDALTDEAVRLYNALTGIRRDALRAIALSDDDPLASLFAIEMGGLSGTEALGRLDQLQPLDALPKTTINSLRARIETGIRMRETAQTVQVGSQIKNFSAPGLDGQTYALEDSLARNKIVLIEFWASWCGPCRTEVPTLKTALAQYGERGFDIFAFSLDDNREDWEIASEEDGITWVNTCDFKAYDSPVPAQFGVLAIPMNVIVDAEGVILGKYVRGERLLETLEELLPDKS